MNCILCTVEQDMMLSFLRDKITLSVTVLSYFPVGSAPRRYPVDVGWLSHINYLFSKFTCNIIDWNINVPVRISKCSYTASLPIQIKIVEFQMGQKIFRALFLGNEVHLETGTGQQSTAFVTYLPQRLYPKVHISQTGPWSNLWETNLCQQLLDRN